MLRVWTKKLGQRHYTRDGMDETLCGKPMLGNNYADVIPEKEQTECEECLKIIQQDNESHNDEENVDIKKLKEIQSKMLELLEEAEYIVKINGSSHIYDRARAYWIPYIKTALLNDSEYVGKSMVTMEDTISEIDAKLKKEEDTEDD